MRNIHQQVQQRKRSQPPSDPGVRAPATHADARHGEEDSVNGQVELQLSEVVLGQSRRDRAQISAER